MRSIRTKITILNVVAVSVALLVATTISAITVAVQGHERSEESLRLLCQTGKNNLNYYFESVEQSVKTVSSLVDNHLDSMSDEDFNTKFHGHIENARSVFSKAAENTNGVLTYYYRIDPSITATTGEKGFWYIDLDGKGFKEHEVTDLSDDHYECIWFYEPKADGKPHWLAPYVTDNLDVYVVSYNVPVFRNNNFVGVVGIEIDYNTLGEQIKNIKAQKTGYAFIVDSDSTSLIYHPYIDLLSMPEAERPTTPPEFTRDMKAGKSHIQYRFQGVDKHSYWLPLTNEMNIVVTVPAAEVNETWLSFLMWLIAAAAILIAASILVTVLYTRRITRPLKEITQAAEEINRGNYAVELSYKENDEIGILTTTMNGLVHHLGEYINDLNNLAYEDALTSIQNKNAFDLREKELQERIDSPEDHPEFAIVILDCDSLKNINDAYGHDKGDIYLRSSCHVICRVFQNSPVYRIGGDEFAVILLDRDYKNRHNLKAAFEQRCAEVYAFAKEPWERICVSIGVASYDPSIDKSFHDVMVRADHEMYQNKRKHKKHQGN